MRVAALGLLALLVAAPVAGKEAVCAEENAAVSGTSLIQINSQQAMAGGSSLKVWDAARKVTTIALQSVQQRLLRQPPATQETDPLVQELMLELEALTAFNLLLLY
eukprot:5667645-Amphidinium_carterae.1